ncbi:hypothetical protein EON68_04735, partial [archaeon]
MAASSAGQRGLSDDVARMLLGDHYDAWAAGEGRTPTPAEIPPPRPASEAAVEAEPVAEGATHDGEGVLSDAGAAETHGVEVLPGGSDDPSARRSDAASRVRGYILEDGTYVDADHMEHEAPHAAPRAHAAAGESVDVTNAAAAAAAAEQEGGVEIDSASAQSPPSPPLQAAHPDVRRARTEEIMRLLQMEDGADEEVPDVSQLLATVDVVPDIATMDERATLIGHGAPGSSMHRGGGGGHDDGNSGDGAGGAPATDAGDSGSPGGSGGSAAAAAARARMETHKALS